MFLICLPPPSLLCCVSLVRSSQSLAVPNHCSLKPWLPKTHQSVCFHSAFTMMINFLFSLIIFYPEKLCQKIRCFVSVALFDILSNKLWNLCHGAAVTAGLCIVLLVSPVHLLPPSLFSLTCWRCGYNSGVAHLPLIYSSPADYITLVSLQLWGQIVP